MEFLKLLEGFRTAFTDSLFLAITTLGEEMIFIVIGLVFFWCINKKDGYYILSVGFAGLVINQFLKLLFRIPRPWVRDPEFKPVAGAVEEATGYSFPSGHTQSAVGAFGSIARIYNKLWVRVLCIAVCLLVPFSRMYLGVHTPADVSVSMVIAVIMVFALYPLIGKAMESRRNMRIFFGIMLSVSAAFLAFVHFYKFPVGSDMENINSGIENAYKIVGCVLGLWLAYEIEDRFIKFYTRAALWVQILKLFLGIIPLLVIKEGLKMPLNMMLGESFGGGVRYFLVTLFAGGIWPITFKYFNKLSKR